MEAGVGGGFDWVWMSRIMSEGSGRGGLGAGFDSDEGGYGEHRGVT